MTPGQTGVATLPVKTTSYTVENIKIDSNWSLSTLMTVTQVGYHATYFFILSTAYIICEPQDLPPWCMTQYVLKDLVDIIDKRPMETKVAV